jgi:hypothetical protein
MLKMCLDYSLVSSNDPNKDLVILTILSVHVVMQHLIPMICTVSFQESFNLQEACHRERNTPQCHPISSDCSVAAAFYCACALTGRLHIRSTVPSPLVTIVERERLGVERGRREQEPRAASPGRMWDALPF